MNPDVSQNGYISSKKGTRGETTEERFRRLSEARVNAILDKLRLLGQCANRKNYSYTEEEVATIFRVINAELRAVRSKFESRESEGRKFQWKS